MPAQNQFVSIKVPKTKDIHHACKFQNGVFVSSQSLGTQWPADQVEEWHPIAAGTHGMAPPDK